MFIMSAASRRSRLPEPAGGGLAGSCSALAVLALLAGVRRASLARRLRSSPHRPSPTRSRSPGSSVPVIVKAPSGYLERPDAGGLRPQGRRPLGPLPRLRAPRRGALEPGLPPGPLRQHGDGGRLEASHEADRLLPRRRAAGRRVRPRDLRRRGHQGRRAVHRGSRRRCANRSPPGRPTARPRSTTRSRSCRGSPATAATSSAPPC